MKTYPNIDWSLAPENADAWEMIAPGIAAWTEVETLSPTKITDTSPKAGLTTTVIAHAPDFGFKGNWQQSYTRRP